jgi:SAM-dependent methyltransferase
MRRATLDLLRCPRCHAASLVPDGATPEPALLFGPVRCLGCSSRYPVHEGLIDLVHERAKPSGVQQALELPWVARAWERYLRPAVGAVLTRGRLDLDSEYAAIHTMLGVPDGPVVDLGCGSGTFLRRLIRDFRDVPLIGVDVSRPMIEEAMAQVRENALAADFVRALVPPLPFVDHSIAAIVATSFVHYVADLDGLMAEVARALKPRGRLVATTYEATGLPKGVHASAGLHPRGELALRESAAKAGLIHFERMKVRPFLIWKVELP